MFLTQDFRTGDLVTLKLVTRVCVTWVDDLRLRTERGSASPQTRQSGLHGSSDPIVWVLVHPYCHKVLLEWLSHLSDSFSLCCLFHPNFRTSNAATPSHFILTWSHCLCAFSLLLNVSFPWPPGSNSDLILTNLPLIPFSFLNVKHQNLEF